MTLVGLLSLICSISFAIAYSYVNKGSITYIGGYLLLESFLKEGLLCLAKVFFTLHLCLVAEYPLSMLM